MITRGQQATAQIVLDTILDLEPVNLFLERTSLTRAVSLIEMGHWRHDNPINKSEKNLTNMEKITLKLKEILKQDYNKKTDKIIQENILDMNFQIKIENRETIVEPRITDFSCFTDGSKDDQGNTGYGYTIIGKNDIGNSINLIQKSRKIDNACSVFQAEVLAIKESAEILIMNKITNKEIEIHSDSQAAIKSFNKRKITNSITLECINMLNKLGEKNKVTVAWIPGHRGFEGNELADKLAKEGAQLTKESTIKSVIPHSHKLKIIKNHYSQSQLSAWKTANISEKTKEMINPILAKCNNNIKKLGKSMCELQTKQIRLITQILSGKNRLNYHMFNIGYTYSKECDYCQADNEGKRKFWEEEEETAFHIIAECPTFSTLRQKEFGESKLTDLSLPQQKGIKETLKKICRFFETTKVLERPNKYEKWQLSPPRKKFRK